MVSEIFDDDIKQILEIQKECRLSVWTFDDYRQELEKGYTRIFVAKTSQRTIGFLASRFLLKSSSEETNADDKGSIYSEAEILNFGVFEKWRKQKVGTFLFNKLLQNARDSFLRAIWLEVRVSNLKAINFYSNKGFVEIETRKNFYTQPTEDAIVMKLDLSNANDPSAETKLDSATDFEITSLRKPL